MESFSASVEVAAFGGLYLMEEETPMGNKSHQMQPQGPNKRSTGSSIIVAASASPTQYLILFVYYATVLAYILMPDTKAN